jgi:sec-independent protein translocase protein TatA
MSIGLTEILLILVIVLLLFGPRRLPELARAMGDAVREYRSALAGNKPKKNKKLNG